MYDITICIVTYKNDVDELMRAVNSALNTKLNVRLYIVDNSPTEDLKVNFRDDRIEYISNKSNLGFGAGHNIAIRKAIDHSKYHLILNPDIYFEGGTLERILSFMDEENYGLLNPKITDFGEKRLKYIRALLPTPFDIFGKLIFPLAKDKIEYKMRTKKYSYDIISSAPFLSGCFMFCKTSEFKKIGMFDERFFMYMEDVDISRRFYKYSSTIYYPFVTVEHLGRRESHKDIKLLKIHMKSAIQYFNKWGWFVDSERKSMNIKALKSLDYAKG